MAKPLKLQIVEQARALIVDESHWCRGELARDVNGMGICPMSDTAVKRCGLGALIMAAYQVTNDRWEAHQSHAAAARQCHTCQRQRREGSCCGAGAVR
jgi:hypothetical protein